MTWVNLHLGTLNIWTFYPCFLQNSVFSLPSGIAKICRENFLHFNLYNNLYVFIIVCQKKNIGVYVFCFELEPCKHDNSQQEFAHFYCTVANTMFSYSTSSVIASPTHHNSCFKLQI